MFAQGKDKATFHKNMTDDQIELLKDQEVSFNCWVMVADYYML